MKKIKRFGSLARLVKKGVLTMGSGPQHKGFCALNLSFNKYFDFPREALENNAISSSEFSTLLLILTI